MKITNTSKTERHPEWCMGGNPGAIEAQERKGQRELVAAQNMLPTDVRGREKLEKLGVVFGEPHEDDELFCEAKLPEGWKIVATDHQMWSELLDEEDKKVAGIFYKAAFYDRRASISYQE